MSCYVDPDEGHDNFLMSGALQLEEVVAFSKGNQDTFLWRVLVPF